MATAAAVAATVDVDRSVRIPEDTLFTGKVRYQRAQYALVLYRDRLAFFGADSKAAFAIFLEDVYAAELATRAVKGRPDQYVVTLSIFVPKGRDKNRGDPVHGVDPKRGRANEYDFEASTQTEQIAWVNHICAAARGITVEELNARPRRRVLVVVNPFGGTGKARKIFSSVVAPMLARAGVEVDKVETESALHGTQLMKTLPLGKYEAIVSVSGDGLLHELLNGLLDRPDWPRAIATPMAIIPAGSGNAIAKSMDCEDPMAATFALIRGKAAPWDIMGIKQGDHVLYSHLSLTHAMIADIDIGYEAYRFMGAARYTMGAVIRLLNVRSYQVKFAYLPARVVRSPPDYATATTSLNVPNSRYGPRLNFADMSYETVPEDWVKQETSLSVFIASKASWLSLDLQTCPDALLGDGYIDLLTAEEARSRMLIPFFLDTESGDVARAPFVTYQKVHAVYLDPVSRRGFVAIDGEGMPVEPAVAEVFPGLARLMMPSESPHCRAAAK